MSGQIPNKIWLFRIIHIDNLKYVLQHGLHSINHAETDPNYINIGDTNLIGQRKDYPVKLEGYGNLGDYIPFYFGPLSPMLYNIKTGHRGITKYSQKDIVYICCLLPDIIEYCFSWCFTDGHAKARITDFFNNLDDLDKVDWNMVYEKIWNNNDEDYDRMRRKQAEFLVKDYLPVNCISRIIVFDDTIRKLAVDILNELGLEIIVKVNWKNKFYY